MNGTLLQFLTDEKQGNLSGGIYHKIQVEMTYNSNHMEGSKLTEEQTRYIFDTNTLELDKETVNIDDILETVNHFRCIDRVIDQVQKPLSHELLKTLHGLLFRSTSHERKEWFAIGDYKRLPNEVGGTKTTLPEDVTIAMETLLEQYETSYGDGKEKTLEHLLEFHVHFEKIHPFQDGNGRIGRLILFKECLRNKVVPFIIEDELKFYYYRGIREWTQEKGYLRDTCLMAQDKFKKYLDYFGIVYDRG